MRVFIENCTERENLFKKIKECYGTFSNFRLLYNIKKSSFDRYKSGKSTIPKDLLDRTLSKINSEINSKKILEDNWGASKGGKITYHRHPHLFKIRRKNGLKKLLEINKNEINMSNFNIFKFSELVGAFIGDGHIEKNGRYTLVISGHKILDKDYHIYLRDIIKELFRVRVHLYTQGGGRKIHVNSKSLVSFLVDFGL